MDAPAIEVEAPQQGSGVQVAKDLFSGAVGGIAQVLLGKFNSLGVSLGALRQGMLVVVVRDPEI